jgi:hypothetical protein
MLHSFETETPCWLGSSPGNLHAWVHGLVNETEDVGLGQSKPRCRQQGASVVEASPVGGQA